MQHLLFTREKRRCVAARTPPLCPIGCVSLFASILAASVDSTSSGGVDSTAYIENGVRVLASCECELEIKSASQARVLWVLLAINGAMFVAELGAGIVAESTALIADSFDMLADAAVYAVSLYAVSRSALARASAARLSGYLQLSLGVLAFFEVARRALVGSSPEPSFMIAVSTIALAANVVCLRLIAAHREGGVHMRASFIFSQNDVIANCAVVLSGLFVALSGWPFWDLLAGAGIGILVFWGGLRILREARTATNAVSNTGSADVPPSDRSS